MCPITCNGCFYEGVSNITAYLEKDYLNIYNAKCLKCKNLKDIDFM